jgi:hypothetical protein
LALKEITAKFNGWLLFRQYVPKTNRTFSIKIYNFNKTGYTYDMRVGLGKDAQNVTDKITVILAAARHLIWMAKEVGC